MQEVYIWVIIDILLFNIFICPLFLNFKISRGRVFFYSKESKCALIFIILLLLFFCIYDKTSGDYFHYEEKIWEIKKYHSWDPGVEDFYNILIEKTFYSYFLFRIIIWGTSLLLFHKLLKMMKLESVLAYALFALVLLRYFSYGRYTLAISVFLLGFTYFRLEKKFLLGLMIMLLAPLFHKSILILYPTLLLLILPLNKKTLLFLVFLGVIILQIVNNYFDDILHLLTPEDNMRELQTLNAEREYDNSIREFFMFYSYFIPILVFLFYFWKMKNMKCLPQFYIDLIKLSVGLLFIATLFYLFDVGKASLFNRTRNLAFFPLYFVITYFIIDKNKRNGNRLSVLYLLIIIYLSDMMYYFYMFYLKTIGEGV